MKRKSDKTDLIIFIMIVIVIAYVSFNTAEAHETPIEKEQTKIVSIATENNNDALILLTRQVEALTRELTAVKVSQSNTNKSIAVITRSKPKAKPKSKPKPKPIRIPSYKLKQLINLYYVKNLSAFTIRCEFIAVHDKDEDHSFTLLKNETLGYKKKYRRKPLLKCRS